jgi:predicted aspartyl protease/tetratricopeptide (TPR) repeat protein
VRGASIVLAALLASAGAAQAECKAGILAELPVTMFGARPSVEAKINGAPTRFLVDTGAFYSIISPGSAAEHHLHVGPGPFGMTMEGVGGRTTISLATVDSFDLSGIPLHHTEFVVGGSETGGELAGVIGRNILSFADVEFDLAGGMMRLVQAKGCAGLSLAYWAKPGQGGGELNIHSPPDDRRGPFNPPIEGDATVNGKHITVVFDTGAATSVMTLSAARRIGLEPNGPGVVDGGPVSGVGQHVVRSWITPVDVFEVGGEQIEHTRLRFADYQLGAADMLLGADFFLSHRVYIANSQRKVWFTYNGGPVFNLTASPEETPAQAAAEAAPVAAADFARRAAAEAARRDFTAAIADYDKAAALDAKNADYPYRRAQARILSGQVALGRADLDKALALDPSLAGALMERATLRLGAHDEAGALSDLDAADKALAPESNDRLRLADGYLSAHAPERALTPLDQWIKVHPDDSHLGPALAGRCWARVLLNAEPDKARADCRRALAVMPGHGLALDGLGFLAWRAGDLDGARAGFDKSLSTNPRNAWSLWGRGLLAARRGTGDRGKADFAAATAIVPSLPQTAAKFGLAADVAKP